MAKQFLKDALGWGFVLWFIGYVLGILLFLVIETSLIGWVILPIGVLIILFVLLKRIKSHSMQYYFLLGVCWVIIAIAGDYFFLVKVFNPADGYYKLDVYLYYMLTLVFPLIIGWYKRDYKQ